MMYSNIHTRVTLDQCTLYAICRLVWYEVILFQFKNNNHYWILEYECRVMFVYFFSNLCNLCIMKISMRVQLNMCSNRTRFACYCTRVMNINELFSESHNWNARANFNRKRVSGSFSILVRVKKQQQQKKKQNNNNNKNNR